MTGFEWTGWEWPFLRATIPLLIIVQATLLCGCVPREPPEDVPVLRIKPAERLELEMGPHRKGTFKHEQYFRTYHFPGLYESAFNRELVELGAKPGRGTGPRMRTPGDPASDPRSEEMVQSELARWQGFAIQARADFPDLSYAMAGTSTQFPVPWLAREDEQEVDADATMAVATARAVAPAHHEDAARLLVRWMKSIEEVGGRIPGYFSVINEPDAQWQPPGDRLHSFIAYHRDMARVVKEHFPGVRITGPCTAWGYPRSDFRRWNDSWEGVFIDEAGDTVDEYDFHFYSKGFWAFIPESRGWDPDQQQDHPSLHAVRRTGIGTIWEFGRIEAYLDMVAARHLVRWGEPVPGVIVSEFGRQGIHPQLGPWENDFKAFLYMTTVTRMWMAFFDRPEVRLTVPFILPRSDEGHAPQRGQAMYTRPGAPQDPTPAPTSFISFYRFFSTLRGERIVHVWADTVEAPDGISAMTLRNKDEVLLLVHNGRAFGDTYTFRIEFPAASPLIQARSFRWEGPLPERMDPAPAGRLVFGEAAARASSDHRSVTVTLEGEETALLSFEATHLPPPQMIRRITAMPTRHPVTLMAAGETISLDPPATIPADAKVFLRVGIAADRGFSGALQLESGGGERLQLDLSDTDGVTDYHALRRLSIPPRFLVDPLRIGLVNEGRITSLTWEIEQRLPSNRDTGVGDQYL